MEARVSDGILYVIRPYGIGQWACGAKRLSTGKTVGLVAKNLPTARRGLLWLLRGGAEDLI